MWHGHRCLLAANVHHIYLSCIDLLHAFMSSVVNRCHCSKTTTFSCRTATAIHFSFSFWPHKNINHIAATKVNFAFDHIDIEHRQSVKRVSIWAKMAHPLFSSDFRYMWLVVFFCYHRLSMSELSLIAYMAIDCCYYYIIRWWLQGMMDFRRYTFWPCIVVSTAGRRHSFSQCHDVPIFSYILPRYVAVRSLLQVSLCMCIENVNMMMCGASLFAPFHLLWKREQIVFLNTLFRQQLSMLMRAKNVAWKINAAATLTYHLVPQNTTSGCCTPSTFNEYLYVPLLLLLYIHYGCI